MLAQYVAKGILRASLYKCTVKNDSQSFERMIIDFPSEYRS